MATTTFSIEMLPAGHGDALWIEYGRPNALNRVLIDGGTVATYPHLSKRIDAVPTNERSFELVVLSHVDADHVEGLVRYFADKPLLCSVDTVMFNGWRQMNPEHGLLGPMQGEFLSALLFNRASNAWDADGKPWVVPDGEPLPKITLKGGMTLTLLSPTPKTLASMAQEWKKVVSPNIKPGDLEAAWKALSKQKKFVPAQGLLGTVPDLDDLLLKQFSPDSAKANGSSIAFLAEYGGKRAMFLADAHPGVVAASLQRLCNAEGVDRIAVDALKLSHHGSKNNTNKALLDLVSSPVFLVSTNGDHFSHPEPACMARVIKYGKPRRMVFNYDTEFTKPWTSASAQEKFGYAAEVRGAKATSIRVAL